MWTTNPDELAAIEESLQCAPTTASSQRASRITAARGAALTPSGLTRSHPQFKRVS